MCSLILEGELYVRVILILNI